jgi:hypothetical protein
MIDQFTVLLPHFLMALAVWRLLHRDDLNNDPALPRRRFAMRKGAKASAPDSGSASDA